MNHQRGGNGGPRPTYWPDRDHPWPFGGMEYPFPNPPHMWRYPPPNYQDHRNRWPHPNQPVGNFHGTTFHHVNEHFQRPPPRDLHRGGFKRQGDEGTSSQNFKKPKVDFSRMSRKGIDNTVGFLHSEHRNRAQDKLDELDIRSQGSDVELHKKSSTSPSNQKKCGEIRLSPESSSSDRGRGKFPGRGRGNFFFNRNPVPVAGNQQLNRHEGKCNEIDFWLQKNKNNQLIGCGIQKEASSKNPLPGSNEERSNAIKEATDRLKKSLLKKKQSINLNELLSSEEKDTSHSNSSKSTSLQKNLSDLQLDASDMKAIGRANPQALDTSYISNDSDDDVIEIERPPSPPKPLINLEESPSKEEDTAKPNAILSKFTAGHSHKNMVRTSSSSNMSGTISSLETNSKPASCSPTNDFRHQQKVIAELQKMGKNKLKELINNPRSRKVECTIKELMKEHRTMISKQLRREAESRISAVGPFVETHPEDESNLLVDFAIDWNKLPGELINSLGDLFHNIGDTEDAEISSPYYSEDVELESLLQFRGNENTLEDMASAPSDNSEEAEGLHEVIQDRRHSFSLDNIGLQIESKESPINNSVMPCDFEIVSNQNPQRITVCSFAKIDLPSDSETFPLEVTQPSTYSCLPSVDDSSFSVNSSASSVPCPINQSSDSCATNQIHSSSSSEMASSCTLECVDHTGVESTLNPLLSGITSEVTESNRSSRLYQPADDCIAQSVVTETTQALRNISQEDENKKRTNDASVEPSVNCSPQKDNDSEHSLSASEHCSSTSQPDNSVQTFEGDREVCHHLKFEQSKEEHYKKKSNKDRRKEKQIYKKKRKKYKKSKRKSKMKEEVKKSAMVDSSSKTFCSLPSTSIQGAKTSQEINSPLATNQSLLCLEKDQPVCSLSREKTLDANTKFCNRLDPCEDNNASLVVEPSVSSSGIQEEHPDIEETTSHVCSDDTATSVVPESEEASESACDQYETDEVSMLPLLMMTVPARTSLDSVSGLSVQEMHEKIAQIDKELQRLVQERLCLTNALKNAQKQKAVHHIHLSPENKPDCTTLIPSNKEIIEPSHNELSSSGAAPHYSSSNILQTEDREESPTICESQLNDVSKQKREVMFKSRKNVSNQVNVGNASVKDCYVCVEKLALESINQHSEERQEGSSVNGLSSSITATDVEQVISPLFEFGDNHGTILDLKICGNFIIAAAQNGFVYMYMISEESSTLVKQFGSKRKDKGSANCIAVNEISTRKSVLCLFVGTGNGWLCAYIMGSGKCIFATRISTCIQCIEINWGYAFCGTKTGCVLPFHLASQTVKEPLSLGGCPVLCIKSCMEGPRKVIVVASRNQPIEIRDAISGLLLRSIPGPDGKETIYSLLLTSNLVYCGTSEENILSFNFQNGDLTAQLKAGKGIVCLAMLSGLLFASGYDSKIYIFDMKSGCLVSSFHGPGKMVLCLDISTDMIVCASKDKPIFAYPFPSRVKAIVQSSRTSGGTGSISQYSKKHVRSLARLFQKARFQLLQKEKRQSNS